MSIKHLRLVLNLCLLLLFPAIFAQSITAIDANARKISRQVTIYRDVYGVPHVFGKSDAATVFGFAYAQAEDNFWQIENNYIRSIGRASEIYGEATLDNDRLLEDPKRL